MQDHKERAPALRATNAVPLLVVLVVLAVTGVAAVDQFRSGAGSAPTAAPLRVESVRADARVAPRSCSTLAVTIRGRAEHGPGTVRYRLVVRGAMTRAEAAGAIRAGADGRFNRVQRVRIRPGDARLSVRVTASGEGTAPAARTGAVARSPARCRSTAP